jgi:hypothetical protein
VPEADDYESSELSLSDVVIRSSSNKIHPRQEQTPTKAEREQTAPMIDTQQVVDCKSFVNVHGHWCCIRSRQATSFKH